ERRRAGAGQSTGSCSTESFYRSVSEGQTTKRKSETKRDTATLSDSRIASGHDSEGRRKNHRESVSWTDHRGESLARSDCSRYYPRDDNDASPEGIRIKNAFKAGFKWNVRLCQDSQGISKHRKETRERARGSHRRFCPFRSESIGYGSIRESRLDGHGQ
ncbi:hypothetical protein V1478_015955, partial [Vespula squamosa]